MLIVIFLIFGIMVMIGKSVLHSVNTSINDSQTFNNASKNIINTVDQNYTTLWDNLFLMLFVGAWLVLLISFYFIQEHPVMTIFAIILIVIFLLLAPIFSNIFLSFGTATNLDSSQFPIMQFIFQNYLAFIISMGLSCVATLYAKGRLQ